MNQETPSQVDLALQEIDQILASDLPDVRDDKFEDEVCSPFTFVELEQALHFTLSPATRPRGLITFPMKC